MIVKLKKILFFGISTQLNDFIFDAQKKGFIEFIKAKRMKHISPSLNLYLEALRILKRESRVKENGSNSKQSGKLV